MTAAPSNLVLVVEDDPATRTIFTRILEHFGFRVRAAENGAVAVQIFQELGSEVALVLIDMSMPVLDGPATMQALLQLNPDTRFIACSGSICSPSVLRRGRPEAVPFLHKPFSAEALVALIRRQLAGPTHRLA